MTKNQEFVDFKFEYITRLFKTISHKKFESYVIHRIWDKLNDDQILFIAQQYIKRGEKDKYALADLYLPQINVVIEINEAYHYTIDQKAKDKVRKQEIEKMAKTKVLVINCKSTLDDVDKQINKIVWKIRFKILIAKICGKFHPWNGGETHSADFHKKKGYLSVIEREYFTTIDDIAATFNTRVKNRGFLRIGGVDLQNSNYTLWWPSSTNKNWKNIICGDYEQIIESNIDPQKAKEHFNLHMDLYKKKELRKRIVFYHEKDELGFNMYRFIGIFELNANISQKEHKTVWERIDTKISKELFRTLTVSK